MFRVLRLHLLDPPRRMRVTSGLIACDLRKERLAFTKESTQDGVDQAFCSRRARRDTRPHRLIDDHMSRHACVDELIKRNAQQVAHTLVLEGLVQELLEY